MKIEVTNDKRGANIAYYFFFNLMANDIGEKLVNQFNKLYRTEREGNPIMTEEFYVEMAKDFLDDLGVEVPEQFQTL